jgi:uncharacterized repeat protein (TIGR03803 family)
MRRSFRLKVSRKPFLEVLEDRALPSIVTLAAFPTTPAATYAGLVEDSHGNLFGTTLSGGASNDGTVFEVAAGSGTVTTVASFNGTDGSGPQGGLVIDQNGDLFGTTEHGGASGDGAVFEVVAGSNAITLLGSFDNDSGFSPLATMTIDGAGDLFGTTFQGGGNELGTVFEVKAGTGTRSIERIASFEDADGFSPRSGVVLDGHGNLFGATPSGGTNGDGTVYEIAANTDAIIPLASFSSATGADSFGGIAVDGHDNVFGVTYTGGTASDGSIFEVPAASNNIETLASFNGSNGKIPECVPVLDSAGDLFGTTTQGGASSFGTVFELPAGSSTITDLHSFSGNDGSSPYAGPYLDSSGNLFGTTTGGLNATNGIVFVVPAGVPHVNAPAVTYGQSAAITINVASSYLPSTTPTGNVTVSVDNGAPITQALVDGAATFTVSGLHAGTHNLTAAYAAQDDFLAGSSTGSLTVNPAPLTVSADNKSMIAGNPLPQLTASFTGFVNGDNSASLTTQPTLSTTASLTVAGTYPITASGAVDPDYTISYQNGVLTVNPPAAEISGTVFQDININGVQNSGEPGIVGVTVYLDRNGSGTLEAGDPTALTDSNGNYQLPAATAGTYTVRELLYGGVLLDAPASGSYVEDVTTGVNISGQNFADVPTSIAIPLTLPLTTAFPKQGDPVEDFVEAIYRAVLDRNADAGGLASWTSQLKSGTLTRLQMVQEIRQSPEHFSQEVTDFYFTLLNRAPDSSGLASWVQQLENGTVTEQQVAFDFLDSPEYLGKGDKYFVDQMYEALLGRTFDAAGETSWLNSLGDNASGTATHTPTLTHVQVINDFLYSSESLNRLVQGYYQIFLQRLADPSGLNSWLSQLNGGASFLIIGQGFLASDEFYNDAAAQG